MDDNSLDSIIDNILPMSLEDSEDSQDPESLSHISYTHDIKDEKSDKSKTKFSLRHYWFEILLFMICVTYLYYVSSSIFNYTIFGLSIGRFLMQILVFVLPFLGLWLFYRVNKSRKVDSVPKSDTSFPSVNNQNLMIAMRQHGRCASCKSVLDKNYKIEMIRNADRKGLRAVCQTCFDRSCLNNSLYKTLRDF